MCTPGSRQLADVDQIAAADLGQLGGEGLALGPEAGHAARLEEAVEAAELEAVEACLGREALGEERGWKEARAEQDRGEGAGEHGHARDLGRPREREHGEAAEQLEEGDAVRGWLEHAE